MLGGSFLSLILCDYLAHYDQSIIVQACISQNTIQKEFEFILYELEEAIIIKDTVVNSISYSNKQAKIIQNQISPD